MYSSEVLMVLRLAQKILKDGKGCQMRWLNAFAFKNLWWQAYEKIKENMVSPNDTHSKPESIILGPHSYSNLHNTFVCQHQWGSFKTAVSSLKSVTWKARVRLTAITNANQTYALREHKQFLKGFNLAISQARYSRYTLCPEPTEA